VIFEKTCGITLQQIGFKSFRDLIVIKLAHYFFIKCRLDFPASSYLMDVVSLQMEKLARSLYLKRKDPKDCALLYVSLNRLQVLAGLFKLSKDEKDKPLVGFLLRNFQVLWCTYHTTNFAMSVNFSSSWLCCTFRLSF